MMINKSWLFLVNMEGLTAADMQRYFRVVKGYKKIERRGGKEVEYNKAGVVAEADDVDWIGGGCFMVKGSVEVMEKIRGTINGLAIGLTVFDCVEV